MLTKTWYQLIQ